MKAPQNKRTPLRGSLFLAGLFGFVSPAIASIQPGLVDDDEEEAVEEDEDGDKWLAISGGDVYTGVGDVLRGATVLSKNGVIEEIGFDLRLPEDTEVLNVRGYRVYPGLVALSATQQVTQGGFLSARPPGFDALSGGTASPSPSESSDSEGFEDGPVYYPPYPGEQLVLDEAVSPPTRTALEDAFDPFSSHLVLALATGITTAQQGQAAASLLRWELGDIELRSGYLTTFSYTSRNPVGKADLRSKFLRAVEYQRLYREYEAEKRSNKDLEEPDKRGVDQRVLAVLSGENRALFSANDRNDLLEIARLAQEFGFRPVIQGCLEGWTVADELGRAGATAILTPRSRRDPSEELVRDGGSSIENAAILHAAGVAVAIAPSNGGIDLGGQTGRDLMHLPIEAGFAVRGGLSDEAALAGITIEAARVLGVADQVGTLEPGKRCDAIVADGDILHYQTFVQWAVVGGKLVYDKEDELFFAHIRPRPGDETLGLDVPSDEDNFPVDEDQDADEDEHGEGEHEGEGDEERGGDDADG